LAASTIALTLLTIFWAIERSANLKLKGHDLATLTLPYGRRPRAATFRWLA
jgi:hypothetical protein